MASLNSSMLLFRSQHNNGLHFLNPITVNSNPSSFLSTGIARKSSFGLKNYCRMIRATIVSGGAEQGSFLNESGEQRAAIKMEPDVIAFGTLTAEIIPKTSGCFTSNDEFDLDHPTGGFSSITEALEDIRQGKMVIVVDDEDRENEGDLIMAASLVTPEAMAFIVKHGTGIVCVSMKDEDLERLHLPLMVSQKENEDKLRTAFTVSVDAKYGTTTGVSASDRAKTILALASRDSKPEDFNRPGHIFPLKYREGGVLKRAGHTEASVDLAVLAGLDPVAVLCEVVDSDGSMARLPRLRQFAKAENLKIISIADLIRYRRKRDKLVEKAAAAPIPTMWGPFTAYCFRSLLDGMEHIAMVKVSKKLNWRNIKVMALYLLRCFTNVYLYHLLSFVFFFKIILYIYTMHTCLLSLVYILFSANLQIFYPLIAYLGNFCELCIPCFICCKYQYVWLIVLIQGEIGDGLDVLVRVHSECLTGDIFGSARCDCGSQLAIAMKQIEAAGRGVLLYLRGHEGRGIGLGHKLRAYNLQSEEYDTVEANEELGLPVDSREYGIGAQILRDLGVHTMKLMTNNPAKYVGLKGYGLAVSGRVPLLTPITWENRRHKDSNAHANGTFNQPPEQSER